MSNSYYTEKDLLEIGFNKIGNNVLISKKTSIYGANNISIGNDVRIDDFSILSGKIVIGNNVHIASYCGIFSGNGGVFLEDYVGLSSRVTIYAVTDDYSGLALTNPTIPEEFRMITSKEVVINKHALVGTDCTILPGVVIAEGSSFGAKSLIIKDSEPWSINAGIPCKKIKERNKDLLKLEEEYVNKYHI